MNRRNSERPAANERQPAAASAPAEEAASLTRREVADRLATSVASVRRLEGSFLHPTKDEAGRWCFDPAEVASIVAARSAALPAREAKKTPGELAAEAFELFALGHGFREVVTKLREPPEVIRRLYEQWRDDGDLWVHRSEVGEIRKLAQRRVESLRSARVTTSADLLALVENLCRELDDERDRANDNAEFIWELKAKMRRLRATLAEVRESSGFATKDPTAASSAGRGP